jgi:hypothetical protein
MIAFSGYVLALLMIRAVHSSVLNTGRSEMVKTSHTEKHLTANESVKDYSLEAGKPLRALELEEPSSHMFSSYVKPQGLDLAKSGYFCVLLNRDC